jgi:hypothetical protein
MRDLRRLHLWFGLAALGTFLLTGAYMQERVPPVEDLDFAQRILFRSRHIYILAGALAHLLLGTYLSVATGRRARSCQAIGSGLLFLAVPLLLAAFVLEPPALDLGGAASGYGLYALLGGVILHLCGGARRETA